jgi:hypothetical protein
MATSKNQISNPYDNLALLHNNGLDSVIKGLSPRKVTIEKIIEENILFSEIPQDEKQYPLLSASVAKLSIEYWITQIEEPKSAWTPFVGDPKAFAWPWKSDANGAVAGAIGGAIAGSPALGGPGILVGGLVGAVGGAIGASVADALFPS